MGFLTNTAGRILFGLPFGVFGLFHFSSGEKMAGVIPGWLPGAWQIWMYLAGAALIAGSIGIILKVKARAACLGLALLMAVFILTLDGPGLANPETAQMATASLLKNLALLGAALFFSNRLD